MAGTIEELLKIEEDAMEHMDTLSDDELFLFSDFLSNLTIKCNREIKYRYGKKKW